MRTRILIAVFSLSITTLFAQTESNEKTIEVKTSSVCGMCKATIEKALKKEDGIVKSKLDVKTKVVAVTYDPTKTSPDKIKKAITMSGYDADTMPADSAAYAKLHECCKKDSKH